MPTATSLILDEDSICRLQLEVHRKELRKVLPRLLLYRNDLEKCLDTTDLNELLLMSELMDLNAAGGGGESREQLEQIYGLTDLIFEKLHLSQRPMKYASFCRVLKDNGFTQAIALLNQQQTPQERRFFVHLAEHYRACLLGDGKSAANDGLVSDALLVTLKDFGALTQTDVDSVDEATNRKMPALLSILMKHDNWPALFLSAIIFESEGSPGSLEQLLPGFEEHLVQSQHCSLEKLRAGLDQVGLERRQAEALVMEAFDCFLQANTCAFEEPSSADVKGAAAAAAATEPPPPPILIGGDCAKAAATAAEDADSKRRLLLPEGVAAAAEATETEEVARHQMRAYQMELADAGLRGRNAMIVAPTGSGKTLVGISIAAKRLMENPEAKVAFLADRTQLVDQQYAAFRESLPEAFRDRVICVRGGSTEPFPLTYGLRENSVMVLSTQILLNNLLDDGDDGLAGDVGRFRLLIFDECHHCDKDHPSKRIMDLYFKYRDAHPLRPLPQIVGLTASPGTEQARDQKDAIEHVLKICANLDCHELSTVRGNRDSLLAAVSNPEDRMHWAEAKPYEDSALLQLDDLMVLAEQDLSDTLGQKLRDLPRPPSARGSLMYTNYCGRLHQLVTAETRDEEARALYAAWKHLSRYNFAHLICSLFRSTDAVKYLRSQFDSDRLASTCPLEERLNSRLQRALAGMDQFCRTRPDAASSSPALDILGGILREQFQQNGDSRVIVFVQQRCFTLAVKDFLDKSQPELAAVGVRTAVMTGANACGAVGGITQNAQTDTLADFRRGLAKILISTSVSEEGLDVQKCNTVVRFCHVTNEIAMVQSKGRGRAEGSTYHVIVPQQLDWLARKEKTNKVRDELMQKAVLKISEMAPLDFQAKMRALQDGMTCLREIRDVRDRAAAAAAAAAAAPAAPSPLYRLQCKRCNVAACTSADLRLMAEKHFVVLHDQLITERRARLVPRDGGSPSDLLGCRLECAQCGTEWGGVRKFKDVVFPWLKVDAFKFVNAAATSAAAVGVKKWTDTVKYFATRELENADLVRKAEALSEVRYMELLAEGLN